MTGEGRAASFVIVSTQRSGSNWVEDRLDSHPEVTLVRSEPFRISSDLPDSWQTYRRASERQRVISTVAPPIAKAAFVGVLLGPPTGGPRGLRVMYDQLRRNPSLGLTLRRHRVRVIHLVRTNVLATHVSSLLAKQSGVFVTREEQHSRGMVTVPIGSLVADLDKRMHLIARFRWLLAHSGLAVLEVAYEDYVTDPGALDRQVLAFLGVEELPLESTFERLSSTAVADRISNRDEVFAALRTSAYRDLLDDY